MTALCCISVAWQVMGVIVIVTSMLIMAPTLQSPEFVFFNFNESVGFPNQFGYVALIGSLAAASTFTGYDTAAHVAEETTDSHQSTPKAMYFVMVYVSVIVIVCLYGVRDNV